MTDHSCDSMGSHSDYYSSSSAKGSSSNGEHDNSTKSRGLVRLNVGGAWFTTTKQTLEKYPDSTLAAMIDKGKASKRDKSGGYYFIDRDGQCFNFILNYLRSKELNLPSNFKLWEQLISDVRFYNLPSLEHEVLRCKDKNREHSVIEVYELAHPEKVGLCCTRVVLNDMLIQTPPFCDVIDLKGQRPEMNVGCRGRYWIRSALTRADWGQVLLEHGWELTGISTFCRQIKDITGDGTLICHVIEKWSHCAAS